MKEWLTDKVKSVKVVEKKTVFEFATYLRDETNVANILDIFSGLGDFDECSSKSLQRLKAFKIVQISQGSWSAKQNCLLCNSIAEASTSTAYDLLMCTHTERPPATAFVICLQLQYIFVSCDFGTTCLCFAQTYNLMHHCENFVDDKRRVFK